MTTRDGPRVPSRMRFDLRTGIVGAESLIYPVIGLLLVAAGALTLIGTVADVIEGSRSRPVTDVGVFLLERILLIFIIAELLYTLRLVDFGGTILVEIGVLGALTLALAISIHLLRRSRASGDE